MRATGWILAIGITLSGCTPPAGRSRSDAGALIEKVERGDAFEARLAEAENRRASGGVTEDDVGNHDVAVRRRAARALARIGGSTSAPLLTKALTDEDAAVVAWAAYGLGYVCRTEGSLIGDIVKALATRAASAPPPDAQVDPLDPQFAIARALGRCASDEAEKTLASWLSGPRPRAAYAALALGDVASKRKALAEPTQLALLAAAAAGASSRPLPEALYPFGRFDHPLASATDRLLEVGVARLSEAGPARTWVVRALSRAGTNAAPELQRVLSHPDTFSPSERAEAARALGRLGDAGQRALASALASLAPARDPLGVTSLGTNAFGPIQIAVQTLTKIDATVGTKKVLYDLAGLPTPGDAPATLLRRVVALRCRAASILVNGGAEDPLLLQCDPKEGGEAGQRAQLEVLGRRPIRGRRLALFRALLGSPHVRVREAALEMLGSHAEIEAASPLVAAALAAKEPGVVATAAQFVVAHPDRISSTATGAHAEIAAKLEEGLARTFAPDDVETVGALIEAAGAARVASAMPKIEAYCRHPNPTLREHAGRALALLKSAKTTCSEAPGDAAGELGHLAAGAIELELDTDAGKLGISLDPTFAPVAVTRFSDLAASGFYDGIVVHRVVAGFVAQFGDPAGDGFGGPGKEPLRCETSPLPFEALRVGVALSGRDTGSSQLFVTLAGTPHLDGDYALVGKATGDWHAVAEGDVIRKVTVKR